MRDAGIDEPRLFQAGDDFDGVPERGPGAFQEPALAPGMPQGVGANDPHAVRAHGTQPLAETLQAAQRALGGGIVQAPAVMQARGQTHHFAQSIEDHQLPVGMARHHHVEAVAPQIDGGQHVGHGGPGAAHLNDASDNWHAQAEKEDPQPLVVLALGLRMTN